VVFWVIGLLAGCASMERGGQRDGNEASQAESPASQVSEEMASAADPDDGAASSNGQSQPPASVNDELMPSLELAPASDKPNEPHFDIDVREAPARAFFNSLVEGTEYNMVVHPDVEGSVSLSLKDVTVPEIMATVQEVYGYDFGRRAGGYIVRPRRMQSRIFEVDYLKLQRQGRSSTVVSSGELSRNENNGNNDGDNGSNNSGNNNRDGQQGAVGTSIRTKTQSDLWTELEQGVRTIVGSGDGRSVVVNPQSSMVVVRAMPDELREVAEFLGESEASLRRQVVLEAKILEVELSEGFRSGINWAALGEPASGKSILGAQTGGGSLLNSSGRGRGQSGQSAISGETGNLDPNNLNQLNNALTSAFGGAFSATAQLGDFTAFIELLETQGDVQVLSSPRVSTINNQKAVIKVGSDEFFATDIDSDTTTTTAATTTSPDVELAAFFSGIALDVTPQISDDGEVILHVHPTISEVEDQRKSFTVGGQTQSIPLALSTVRESDSIVRAESGQIVVIGGLMQETVEDVDAGVPLLKDLPFVGGAFRQTRKSREKTELVILLRPQVIESSEDWKGPLQEGSQRLKRMRRQDSEAGSWEADPGGANGDR
jgi:MSHA biogenesis protein MshL